MAALLFAQLAVSAHACPLATDAGASAQAAIAMPCDGATKPTPLCEKHCNPSEQAQPHGVAMPAAPGPVAVLRVAPVPAITRVAHSGPAVTRAAFPPLILQNCVLRI